MDPIYDVNSYTDAELYNILDLINPSDRELEAKIIFNIRKYQQIQTSEAKLLERFFEIIYERFFITENTKNTKEGFEGIAPTEKIALTKTEPSYVTNPFIKSNDPKENSVVYTNTLTYAPNNLNPLLKQTIKRIVVIDSQYRDWQKSSATDFTVNFSEVLKDVVSLTLTSFQIPYTWYTINNDYGSNFFYIKGNSPGIDNGNHDYQILINPGNYTPVNLNTAIRSSISQLKSNYTDVCFNNTNISYDDTSCKSTINIGIENIYDYSNYTFSFGKWVYPNGNVNERKTNIASFLGFNYASYSTNSIYSMRSVFPNILSGINNYTIDNTNNTIKIIQYWDDSAFSIQDYQTNSSNYKTITLTLNETNISKVSLNDILNDINTQTSSYYFDPTTKLSLIQITDTSLNNVGNAFFEWKIKLNRMNTINRQNARVVVIFPNIQNDPIWVGPSSLFKFNSYINEVNNLISETKVVNQSYDFSGVSIKFKSILSGYDLPINDISYTFPKTSLSLSQLINNTNDNLFKQVGNYPGASNYLSRDGVLSKTDLTGSSLSLNSNSKLQFTVDIIRTIYGNQFKYDISGGFFDNNSIGNIDVSDSYITEGNDQIYVKIYKGQIITNETYSFGSKKLITVRSNLSKYMSDVSYNVYVEKSNVGNGIQGLTDIINQTFGSYTDSPGSYPLNRSYITFTENTDATKYDFTLTVIVKKILTESNYSLILSEPEKSIDDSIWGLKYNFKSEESIYKVDISYNLSDNIVSNVPVDRTIIYDLSAIYLNFYCTTANFTYNNIEIHLPNNKYSITEFCDALNSEFSNNQYLSGTTISINNYLEITFIISKVFNKISDFILSPRNVLLFLNDVNNGTPEINIYNEIATYSGALLYSEKYNLGSNQIIMDLSSTNIGMNISYEIPIQLTSYVYINELKNSINYAVTHFIDNESDKPFSNSGFDYNPIYSMKNFTYSLDKNWTIYSNHITKSPTEISFNVIYSGYPTTDYISTSIIYDMSLSFDVLYNTIGASISQNRRFNISKIKDQILNSDIFINDTTDTTSIGQIPINTNDTSGSFHVHMNIYAGDNIYFKLVSNDYSTGSTKITIKNIEYTQSVPIYYDWSLNLIYNKELTQNDYSVKFSDYHFGDISNSIWYKYFDNNSKITPISKTIDYTLQKYSTENNNSIINSVSVVNLDQIKLSKDGIANLLFLKPWSEGVYDQKNKNDLSFNVPEQTYNSTENLINVINSLFDANPITKGTIVSILSTGFTQIRWNINKIYTTEDYILVFYDIASFVKCFVGNASYRNSSPDSTLGWILGFHSCTEYFLKEQFYSSGYYVNPTTLLKTNNSYNISYVNGLSGAIKEITITGDTILNVDLYKYMMVIIDDYTQNHLNDGLVTITQKDTGLVLPSYATRSKYECDPITGEVVNTGITLGTNNLTQNQLYSINQIINSQNTKISLISSGPFVKDVFAMIPLDIGGMLPGQSFTDKATAVQDRIYFGPVNIHKLAVKLINDKGDVIDLNGANWSLQLICEQLYQTSPVKT